MTGKHKAYSDYKDSGVEWVGKIPTQWSVEPLFSVTSSATIKNTDGKETNVLSLSYGRIIQRDIEKNYGLLPASFNTYQLVKSGDIILRLTDLQNDKKSLRVGHAKEQGIITSAYLKLTAHKNVLNHRYLYRLLHSYDTTKVFYGMGGGLRQSMKFDDMRRLSILLPSYAEQIKIAAFLDHETGKIDALIEKQKRLIELLKEKRQAVISHAVTKGLNPDAPMKDSGVEWLGDIPEHWDAVPLKHLCNLLKDGTHLPPPRVDLGIPLLSVRNIIDGKFVFRDDDSQISKNDYEILCKAFTPKKNDVLLAIVGGTIGKTAVINDMSEFHIQRSVAIFRVKPVLINHESLRNVFSSLNFQSLLWEYVGFSAQPGIYLGTLENFRLPVPPVDEQLEINRFLRSKTNNFDDLISKAESAITLMQERRTALISAAVTGKIDVRNWGAPQETKQEQAA